MISELPSLTNFDGILLASGSILYSFEGQAMARPAVYSFYNNILRFCRWKTV